MGGMGRQVSRAFRSRRVKSRAGFDADDGRNGTHSTTNRLPMLSEVEGHPARDSMIAPIGLTEPDCRLMPHMPGWRYSTPLLQLIAEDDAELLLDDTSR